MHRLVLEENYILVLKKAMHLVDYQIYKFILQTFGNILLQNQSNGEAKYLIQERALKEGLLEILIESL
jgi:hypothetical protein